MISLLHWLTEIITISFLRLIYQVATVIGNEIRLKEQMPGWIAIELFSIDLKLLFQVG